MRQIPLYIRTSGGGLLLISRIVHWVGGGRRSAADSAQPGQRRHASQAIVARRRPVRLAYPYASGLRETIPVCEWSTGDDSVSPTKHNPGGPPLKACPTGVSMVRHQGLEPRTR